MSTGERPELTLTEAADACGVDRRTIRRRLDAGEFPGAYRAAGPRGADTGPWMLPIGDLLAAGFHPNAATPAGPAPVDARTDVDRLRDELAEWRRRAEVAEALAAEREKRAETAELALRMLTTGDTVVAVRRRWWRRSPR